MFLSRRQQLFTAMSDNSVAIFCAAEEQTRSRDTEFPFRQDSDFYYFSGFNEPKALLLLIKQAGETRTVLFNRSKDKLAEIWQGRRVGQEQAVESLGIDKALAVEDLAELLHLELDSLDKVYLAQGRYPAYDQLIFSAIESLRNGLRQGFKAPSQIEDWRPIVDEMRLIKSADEVALMRKAGEISAAGHVRAMRGSKVGMFEYQLEAEIHHEFLMAGARSPAYGTIVGAGDNACILHYTENQSAMQNGDLVLIDAGAEYQMYAGDITRTFPVNGKFSPEQAKLYNVVLAAQVAAIEMLKPGVSIFEANQVVLNIMVSGLVELGIMQGDVATLIEEEAYKEYYMHGLGHWIGLDVHDVGDYYDVKRTRPLAEGMAITIEPGLYIPADADVPAAYKGVGIRIEDDVVITANGCEVLTADVPKTIAEIEALMAS
ncbi:MULTISPECIES: Xaa-Pro aminopeptidase [unclassified Agarivorans]|uniref:Xaa-Pro aminopeptidase n=1 Tax=unclassified Agarivorans TaxID=2636026 RepID=UPI0026E134D4|nr:MULTISPECIES: Xaa-Pro aminopeptidase [unclassified Agarivorans]MDO6683851.1 Xaa-Pro aminopeptidase [Agarivorans sp. 3_MG-2023]MDO6714416.1 Xaa-Pro aminopeptidase [Agarivorans sp. 2_MG-2023]